MMNMEARSHLPCENSQSVVSRGTESGFTVSRPDTAPSAPRSALWPIAPVGNPRLVSVEPQFWTAFPDGQSALMLVAARLRHIAGTKWGTRRYLDMDRLRNIAAFVVALLHQHH